MDFDKYPYLKKKKCKDVEIKNVEKSVITLVSNYNIKIGLIVYSPCKFKVDRFSTIFYNLRKKEEKNTCLVTNIMHSQKFLIM